MLVPSVLHCSEPLLQGSLRGIVTVPTQFSELLAAKVEEVVVFASVSIIFDGSTPLSILRVDFAIEVIEVGSGPLLQ